MGRDWVMATFRDRNVDPGSAKYVDPGTFSMKTFHENDFGKIFEAVKCYSKIEQAGEN